MYRFLFVLSTLVLIFHSTNIFAFEPLFDTWIGYEVGSRPGGIATADLDGDGDFDLVTANAGDSSISVLKNRGDGTFEDQVIYRTGNGPRSIIVSDLDGDGDLDLATANFTDDSVSVLKNNGDATFGGRIGFPTGNGPSALVTGDIDADGDVDLIFTNYNDTTVSTLKNLGDGSFSGKVDYKVGAQSFSVFASDLDADGDLDLTVANYRKGISYGQSFSVLKNNGDGTFAFKVDYQTGGLPASLSASDFDGDGDADLAVVSVFDSVIIHRNDGTGNFTIGAVYSLEGSRPTSVSASDIDGDGDRDLIITVNTFCAHFGCYDGTNAALIFKNDGAGNFADGVIYRTGYGPSGSCTADLDADGDLDLAVANLGSNCSNSPCPVGTISVLKNLEGGIFPSPARSLAYYPLSMFGSDLDNDGDADLLTLCDGLISILKNSGDANFSQLTTYEDPNISGYGELFVADLDADSDGDIVVTENLAVSVLKNQGDGIFSHDASYPMAASPSSVFASDLDGDGDPDLAVARDGYALLLWMNAGDGTFSAGPQYSVGPYPTAVVASDLDADGDSDLVVANGSFVPPNNTVTIFKNNGDGTFIFSADYPVGISPRSIFSADFDGDGDKDLAVANAGENTISVLLNNGDGTFLPNVDYQVGIGPSSVFASDLDGDGDPDLAVAKAEGFGAHDVSILFNNGSGTFSGRIDYGVGGASSSLWASDLDGDADSDLAVAVSGGFYGNIDSAVVVLKNLSNPRNCPTINGDISIDGELTPADIVLMLNCVFLATGNCTFCFSDVNCDGKLTPADVVLELNAVFLTTSFPC